MSAAWLCYKARVTSSVQVQRRAPARERVWSWPWRDRLLVGSALGLAVFCLVQLLWMRYGRDQGIYAAVAAVMTEGGMPYRDAWDFKPPGIYFAYALARVLFGDAQWSIRLLEALAFASLVPAFALLSRRWFHDVRPGILGGCIAAVVQAQHEFWHSAQPESFGGVLSAWAMVLALEAGDGMWQQRRFWRAVVAALGAGVLFGAAGLMKPQLVGGAGVMALWAVWRLHRRGLGWRVAGAALGSVVLGVGLSVGACIAWYHLRGAWADLAEALFVFAPGYAATTLSSGYLVQLFYQAVQGFTVAASSLVFVGLVAAALIGPFDKEQVEGWAVILAVAVLHLAGIGLQAKFFAYHYGATLPLGALLAGLGMWKAWQAAWARGPVLVAVFGVLVWFALVARAPVRDLRGSFWQRSWDRTTAFFRADSSERQALDAQLYTVADVDYGANVRVAQWLEQHTVPDDRVYIWGFEPFIYQYAKRRPSTRYIYNVPQRVSWERDKARTALMRDLRKRPPRAIVVEHHDVFPVVTGNHLDSARALGEFEELRQMVDREYEYRTRIQDFDIYVRR